MSEHNSSSRRQFLKGAALVGAGAVVGACATPVAPSEAGNAAQAPAAAEELYGMVVFLKGSEFFNWCYQGMVDAAARIGPHVKTELQGPAEWDAALEARDRGTHGQGRDRHPDHGRRRRPHGALHQRRHRGHDPGDHL